MDALAKVREKREAMRARLSQLAGKKADAAAATSTTGTASSSAGDAAMEDAATTGEISADVPGKTVKEIDAHAEEMIQERVKKFTMIVLAKYVFSFNLFLFLLLSFVH